MLAEITGSAGMAFAIGVCLVAGIAGSLAVVTARARRPRTVSPPPSATLVVPVVVAVGLGVAAARGAIPWWVVVIGATSVSWAVLGMWARRTH